MIIPFITFLRLIFIMLLLLLNGCMFLEITDAERHCAGWGFDQETYSWCLMQHYEREMH